MFGGGGLNCGEVGNGVGNKYHHGQKIRWTHRQKHISLTKQFAKGHAPNDLFMNIIFYTTDARYHNTFSPKLFNALASLSKTFTSANFSSALSKYCPPSVTFFVTHSLSAFLLSNEASIHQPPLLKRVQRGRRWGNLSKPRQ